MPNKVYLIGENHYDLEKEARYISAINHFKPTTVTIEYDKVSIEELELTFESTINKINTVLTLNENNVKKFETVSLGNVLAINRHCNENDIPIKLIDLRRAKLRKQIDEMYAHKVDVLKCQKPLTEKNKFLEGYGHYLEGIIFANAVGEERVNESCKGGMFGFENFIHALYDLTLKGTEQELNYAQKWIDCYYETYVPKDKGEVLDIEIRDEYTCEQISSLNGTIMHAGGLEHIFGNHFNLYNRLKQKGIDVERYMLIDFSKSNKKELEKYKNSLSPLCEEIIAEAKALYFE
jgi:hypothetical protein